MKIKLCFVLIEIFHFYLRLMEAKGPSSKLPQDVSVHQRSHRVSTTHVCTKCCIKCYMSES